jgi:hypothetical protein
LLGEAEGPVVFPDGFDEEVVKDRAFFIMGNSFKYFRYYPNTQYVRKGIEPEWSEYPHQQECLSDFMSEKQSDETKEQ